jgi:L-asparaginase II
MGAKPETAGSIGDVEKVAKVFVRNELKPLQARFLNSTNGLAEIIRFENTAWMTKTSRH